MEINCLLTAIQWIATVSLAFIAVSYVEKFTTFICEKFFLSNKHIDDEYDKCSDELPDNDTLGNIKPQDINGNSTVNLIEKIRRGREVLLKEISEAKESQKEEFPKVCVIKSFPSISLYVVAFCTALLLLGGIEKVHPHFSHYTCFLLCALSLIYIVMGWMFGEKDKKSWLVRFSSFRHAIICFAISVAFSLAFGIVHALAPVSIEIVEITWWYLLIICLVLSCLNFVMFPIKIGLRAKKLKGDISDGSGDLKEKCVELNTEFNQLLSVSKISDRLKA